MGRFLLSSTIEPAIAVAMCVAAISMYTTASRCVDGQREVLLKFKHNILDEYDELRSWGNHTDCCFHWAGVGCDNATGHVIHIGFSVMGDRKSLERVEEEIAHRSNSSWSKHHGVIAEDLICLQPIKLICISHFQL
ncbi:unnamed protein product [Cuscuta epithymum]|uniref:Leucine-rich repeat-containing N-terminal plant-type domain-containing protein n=1 Tax=Cuscuta epithymum TaxID=186058 RepID=A0AAV0CZ80_9ASTE|nr:unnamed protein product [Cuscuta epithymum]